ncbi:DUF4406 domain-containing protein [Actinophytocola sediminis]
MSHSLSTSRRGERELPVLAALQAFEAIRLRDAVYVACAVSSGRRELDLMIELSTFDRDRLRREHGERWKQRVLEPNRTAASAAVSSVRQRYADRSVINPAEFELEGLTQPDYDSLCERIIRAHVGHLVLADGWQYSRGARIEAVLAMHLSLRVTDGGGDPLGPDSIRELMDVTPALVDAGVPAGIVRELLPEPMSLSPAG